MTSAALFKVEATVQIHSSILLQVTCQALAVGIEALFDVLFECVSVRFS